MVIYPNTKIYIMCPAGCVNGGTELLHQLCHVMRSYSIDAYITYITDKAASIPEKFTAYNVKTISYDFLNINEDAIVIFPEGGTHGIYFEYFAKARKIIWWLSVDNFVNLENEKYNFEERTDLLHLVQSEYARCFLLSKGVKEERIKYLSDFLGFNFLQMAKDVRSVAKENIVLYNPAKGREFTAKIIAAAPYLHFKPIKNMTAQEVVATMAMSKVYIDFGEHPGKDRIPREAAYSGCCVITGRKGSAGNNIDVPIDDEYKFMDEDGSIPAIIEKIKQCLSDYDNEIKKFAAYRQRIAGELDKFLLDFISIFSKSENN